MFKNRAGHKTSERTPSVPATWEAEVGEWGDEKTALSAIPCEVSVSPKSTETWVFGFRSQF